jgi:glycosyltransferase involved in cell wall biosynthesis
MRKIKILYLVDDPNIMRLKQYIKEGNEYPKNYFWWDFSVDDPKYELVYVDTPNLSTGIFKFLEKIFTLRNIPYQLNVLKKQNEYDVIFSTLDYSFHIIFILRYFGILKKPIFALSHMSFNTNISSEKWFWKLRNQFFNFFVINGLDYIAFWSDLILNKAKEANKLSFKNSNILRWGPDLDFYENIKRELDKKNELFFMSVGSSNRDFKLIIKAFENKNHKLKIFQKFHDVNLMNFAISKNIEFNHELTLAATGINLNGLTLLRKAYKESFAVLIPIERQTDCSNGTTTLFEAMACGVPVIVTDNVLFPLDVEKEKVGIKVAFGDLEGWKNAIDYLVNNSDMAEEMGNNGLEFIKKYHNYNNYRKELLSDFDEFIIQHKLSN